MKNIMICMELGDDLGHLTSFHPLITELCTQGFTLYCITKNLQHSHYFTWPKNVYFLQAPLYQSMPPSNTTHSFPDILAYRGYRSVSEINSLASSWNTLYQLIQPICAIFDHSPTALLAFRSYSLPKYIFSNGFITLPVNDPQISLRSGTRLTQDQLQNSSHVLNNINEYLATKNEKPLQNLGELYQTRLTLLIGDKTTDIYQQYRVNERYILQPETNFGFDSPSLSLNQTYNLFAYLKKKGSHSDLVIKTLKELKLTGICYYAGITEEEAKELSTDELYFTHKPVSLNHILPQVSAVICHAGKGLVNTAMQHGLPMILLPTQIEQRWTTKVLEQRQCAIGIYRETADSVAIQKIEHFFSSQVYEKEAKMLAAELNQQASVMNIELFVRQIIADIET